MSFGKIVWTNIRKAKVDSEKKVRCRGQRGQITVKSDCFFNYYLDNSKNYSSILITFGRMV